MRVLALDIASQTGWAADAALADAPIVGSFDVGSDGLNTPSGRAFYLYEHAVVELIERYKPEIVAYEAPIAQEKDRRAVNSLVTSAKLLGLIAVTQMVVYTFHLPLLPCNIQKVRRHFVDNGRASKGDVYARCKMLGWRVANEDESDAAATWDYAKGKLKAQAYLDRAARRA